MKLGDLHVKFEHRYYDWANKDGQQTKVPFATSAKVFDSKGNLLTMGEAHCGQKDLYNKEIGRKISLKRALNSLSLHKEMRTRIWKDYLNRKKE